MNACKQYRRQLALLSANALNEREASDVRAHLKVCSACRAYSDRVQAVTGLFREDAERSVVPADRPLAIPSPRRRDLFTSRTAAAVAAAVVIGFTILLTREHSSRPAVEIPVTSEPGLPPIHSIAESRALLDQDLETLLERPEAYHRSDYVFSVGSRNEGPY
jgi:hypothetical protein